MPIYEYRCEKGHAFEVMQRISDDPVSTCTTCEAPVHRVFRPPAVHFKGSGFYNTDYGTRKRQREMKDSADGGSSASTATESKDSSGDSGSAKSEGKKSDSAKTETKAAPSQSTGSS